MKSIIRIRGATAILDSFITQCISYSVESWIPYGTATLKGSLYWYFLVWYEDFSSDFSNTLKLNQFKNQLYKLKVIKYPHWSNLQDRRRIYQDQKIRGLSGIECNLNNVSPEKPLQEDTSAFSKYTALNWWIHLPHLQFESAQSAVSGPLADQSAQSAVSGPLADQSALSRLAMQDILAAQKMLGTTSKSTT